MGTIRQHFERIRNAQSFTIVGTLLAWIAFNIWDPYRWHLLHRDSAKLGSSVVLAVMILFSNRVRCPRTLRTSQVLERDMGRDGIEPSTSGLKVRCSTD